MRTRIALAAAATAALSIGISSTALTGDAGGSPARAARLAGATHHGRGSGPDLLGRTAAVAVGSPGAPSATPTISVARGMLLPVLSAAHRTDRADMHRTDTHRAARHGLPAPADLARTGAAAHLLQMERTVDAWRAAHPAPVAAPPPAAQPAPAPQPVVVTDATSTTTPDWACIRVHESGDRYNTPAVPGGAYGFLESTWLSLGYGGWPYQAPAAVQDQAVLYLYHEFGWQPWSTRFVCGL